MSPLPYALLAPRPSGSHVKMRRPTLQDLFPLQRHPQPLLAIWYSKMPCYSCVMPCTSASLPTPSSVEIQADSSYAWRRSLSPTEDVGGQSMRMRCCTLSIILLTCIIRHYGMFSTIALCIVTFAEVSFRQVVMKNWLVNTTGYVDGFIPLDLLQEHLNFWIKVSYI